MENVANVVCLRSSVKLISWNPQSEPVINFVRESKSSIYLEFKEKSTRKREVEVASYGKVSK